LINPNTMEVFGDMILRHGTREAAFVHAISSAGIAYRITKDCSKGLIDKCGCDLSALKRTEQYNWNGCSDNVRYGVAVSRAFADAAEKGKNQTVERRIMNLHNNNAGRQVYLEASPDYCESDPERGILGTHGRHCNISSHGIDGCDLLCCYRGFDTRVRKVIDRCNCKFHYCCQVICQPCEKIIEDHICK
uniref:Protein Wnt n=1 Tax=Gongylonema pulchrum TaxID=637853 RepID=A0A183DT50_9BILA